MTRQAHDNKPVDQPLDDGVRIVHDCSITIGGHRNEKTDTNRPNSIRDGAMLTKLTIRTLVLTFLPLSGAFAQHDGRTMGSAPMYHFPRWSPDGKRIVVVALSPTGPRLLVIPVSGGVAAVITTGAVKPMAADWTRDGRIVVIADSPRGSDEAFVVDTSLHGLLSIRRDSVTSATQDSSVLLFEKPEGVIFATDRRRVTARQLTRGSGPSSLRYRPTKRRSSSRSAWTRIIWRSQKSF